ncbi:peptidoglycan-binding domain-containing protein [Microvirga lotononidis]|uniref:Cephalosporin hydroxylase n=1 Tax=Microvirga lotononidis TaxID=864069 RepID=I4YNH2_9HYPH|nr:peptidoglycan-binding domain-containing protein [Microvirga lotononidis]EIM25514.1 cephalosporin hydroxylase [Microvirga lotononidis]WQO26176.1 peptidoglycan-binding domain-containing protein [Microvirga lotononidis]
MREAFVDHPDDDLDLPAVVRRKAPARPAQKRAAKPPRRPGIGERAVSFVVSHPRQILAALFLTGCGGAIAWNALALQITRHPAPLFNTREVVFSPEPKAEGETRQPLPPARPGTQPVDEMALAPSPHETAAHPATEAALPSVATPRAPARSPIADMIRNGGQPVPAAAPAARPPQPSAAAAPAAPPVRSASRDPIADMIRMGGPVPTPPANVGRADQGDTVLAGQRALARLGYSVKVDGQMGSGTRQAIERFEQDRRLPVTGELNARTIRELSAASGIAVP